jgi:ribosomal protein L11 methyltransferase
MSEPTYPLLIVEASSDDVDVLIGRLTLLGADGIEERDATTLARGGALGATLIASFADNNTAQEAYEALKNDYRVHRDELVGDAWRDAWKEHWRPTKITDTVVVVPSWTEYQPAPGEMVLSLDPGRAFGTGQHPSTCLAARSLERHLKPGHTHHVLLDLGCGSGILAFVAVRKQLPRAIACDIDAESIVCAIENAQRLGLHHQIDFRTGGFDVVPETSSLVVANIEASVLIPNAEAVVARVAHGGTLILSGILVEQQSDVEKRYRSLGLFPTHAEIEGHWVAPEFRRP